MRKLVRDVHRAAVAMGDGVKRVYEKEKPARIKMGKKIVAARDLPAGHVLEPERPRLQVARRRVAAVPGRAVLLGKPLTRAVARG